MATGKDAFANRMTTAPNRIVLSAARFRGKLGAAIAVITSLIVGFLTVPNNILYFIDSQHSTRTQRWTYDADPAKTPGGAQDRPGYEWAYIHAGIALVLLGCLAMVVSIVLSYFAAKSKHKMDASEACAGQGSTRSTRTVLTCLIMMNLELFMSVIAGAMELLYQPLIRDEQRLHNTECAIAVFNIVIYMMYVVTMVLTSTVLKGKHERISADAQREVPDSVNVPPSPREYMSRGINPYHSQSNFM